ERTLRAARLVDRRQAADDRRRGERSLPADGAARGQGRPAMTGTSASPRSQIRRGVLLAGLAALLFGMTAPFLKEASAGVGPLFSGSLLYIGAAIGAGLMAAFRRRERGPAPTTRRALGRLAAVALVGAA